MTDAAMLRSQTSNLQPSNPQPGGPQAHADQHHIVSPRVYALIYGALLLGTALTVGAAYVNMGSFNPAVALLIACVKAVLVILFFMHIRYSSRLMMMTVAAGFLTFCALITMTMSDYISRAWGLW